MRGHPPQLPSAALVVTTALLTVSLLLGSGHRRWEEMDSDALNGETLGAVLSLTPAVDLASLPIAAQVGRALEPPLTTGQEPETELEQDSGLPEGLEWLAEARAEWCEKLVDGTGAAADADGRGRPPSLSDELDQMWSAMSAQASEDGAVGIPLPDTAAQIGKAGGEIFFSGSSSEEESLPLRPVDEFSAAASAVRVSSPSALY